MASPALLACERAAELASTRSLPPFCRCWEVAAAAASAAATTSTGSVMTVEVVVSAAVARPVVLSFVWRQDRIVMMMIW